MKKRSQTTGEVKRLGAMTGVFIPTFLSIIGVILYLRLGVIVGTAGLLGTIFIILLASSITLSTGLSLSSITTNIRLGSGAAYSLIAKTLGIEVGGSIGIPLYLAMVFSVSLYLLGFSEAWMFIFPTHSPILVTLLSFLLLFTVTFISTSIALRVQLVVFALVLASLVSMYMGGDWLNIGSQPLLGDFTVTPFWALFALFFPAVTGLMAGIGLSGDLVDPKRQIPKGVLSSLLITTAIYLATAIWLSSSASMEDLRSNHLILVELAAYGPLILVGILAATFSSALTTFVAAPRLLQALASNSVVPMSNFFKKNVNGEARNAIIFSSLVIIASLLLGSLDTIAPLLTMFFLISYAMINIVVYIEQSLGLPSFRPTFRISKIVPLYGAIATIAIMFFISPIVGIISLVFLAGVYLSLVKKKLVQKEGDVRSGLFRTLAEWAAKKVQTLPESTQHTWKANILLPALDTSTIIGNFPLIKAITYPHGTMTVLGMKVKRFKSEPKENQGQSSEPIVDAEELQILIEKFSGEGIFTSSSIVETDDYSKGIAISLEAINSQVFHPNILFLPYKAQQLSMRAIRRIAKACAANSISPMFFDRDEDTGLGSERDIHVWIPASAMDVDFYDERTFDLALLIAYKLQRNWKGVMNIWMCAPKEREVQAKAYIKKLIYESRLPTSTKIHTPNGALVTQVSKAAKGDIHIIPFKIGEMGLMSKLSKIKGKSFLFVNDSSNEDIMA
jgi:solute carrier family 12 (sodium/potassium/chloride transporter), member 2